MLEKEIEKCLVNSCKRIGALCEKFTSPNRRSVPDRIITYEGRIIFVELKRPGGKPTEAQLRDHEMRRSKGATVLWVDTEQGVDEVIKRLTMHIHFEKEHY